VNYDFTTLSPEDFEHLVADLLSCEWNVRIERFKSGKDKGIDLRNTRVLESTGTTIIQCKRYAPQRFAGLLRVATSEKEKIERLKPTRYVLATSVPLSPANKTALMDTLAPWCRSTGDIYGATELNALLQRFPEVEKAHFKLWIGSTAVLERILHSRIFNVTQATVDVIRTHLSRLVMHGGFERALEILHQDHHVLIVGNPGIGKSTLAKMLLCHYLREGFEPICVSGNIDDAWSLVQVPSDDKRKFVVLYDDFLGRYRFESLHFGKNEEVSLFDFLDKVRRAPNIRFLLTTREYILADAQRMHGAFAERAREILKYTLKLEDYSKSHRAKILFNHLYFSDLPDSRLELLVKDQVYKTIVEHKHFNPRNVETISNYANSRAMNDRDYLRYVRQEFNNPARLWEHPFRQDISPIARNILMVLWTFGGPVDLDTLKKAAKQLAPGSEETQFDFQFTDALQQLDGNFIATNRYRGIARKSGHFIVAQFSNPSIEEFIGGFLQTNISWIERLTKSIVCFRQVNELLTQTSGQKIPGLSPSFWKSLREAAASVEIVPGGHLINYRSSRERVRRVWDVPSVDWPDQTRVRLRIEAEARLSDALSEELQRRVTTAEGWRLIIAGSQNDGLQIFHIKRLHAWVGKDSGWPDSTINICQAALRRAVFLSLTDDDDFWTGSIESLRTLAEVVLSSGSTLIDEEKKAFHEAGKIAAETLAENADSSDEIQSEVSELEKLAKISGLDFRREIADLESTADDLQGRGRSEDLYDPESTHVSQIAPEEEFDMDLFFKGLLDR
jgi:DNA polymerase III delta prime subunit